jgi:hypothetical protein
MQGRRDGPQAARRAIGPYENAVKISATTVTSTMRAIRLKAWDTGGSGL